MKLLTTLLLFLISLNVIGQFNQVEQPKEPLTCPESNSGLVFIMGPAANYFQGAYDEGINKFDNDFLNYQLTGFVGVRTSKGNAKNTLGLFATGGYTNKNTFIKMAEVQNITTAELVINKYYAFYQAEAGMLIGNVLRLSTGIGRQEYETINGRANFDYFSSTAGLMIDLGPVYWNIDANIHYGRDYPNTSLRFATGLMIMF